MIVIPKQITDTDKIDRVSVTENERDLQIENKKKENLRAPDMNLSQSNSLEVTDQVIEIIEIVETKGAPTDHETNRHKVLAILIPAEIAANLHEEVIQTKDEIVEKTEEHTTLAVTNKQNSTS
mgnify:CR=1 FL=1